MALTTATNLAANAALANIGGLSDAATHSAARLSAGTKAAMPTQTPTTIASYAAAVRVSVTA